MLAGKKAGIPTTIGTKNIVLLLRYFGCIMTTYNLSDYGGDSHNWQGNIAYVGDDWNDKTSSITVECSAENIEMR